MSVAHLDAAVQRHVSQGRLCSGLFLHRHAAVRCCAGGLQLPLVQGTLVAGGCSTGSDEGRRQQQSLSCHSAQIPLRALGMQQWGCHVPESGSLVYDTLNMAAHGAVLMRVYTRTNTVGRFQGRRRTARADHEPCAAPIAASAAAEP